MRWSCHGWHGLPSGGILAAGSNGRPVRPPRRWRTGSTTGLLQLHELAGCHRFTHAARHAAWTGGCCWPAAAVTATTTGAIAAYRLADELKSVGCGRFASIGTTGVGSTRTGSGRCSLTLGRPGPLRRRGTLVLASWLCGTWAHTRTLAATDFGGCTGGTLRLGTTNQFRFSRWSLRGRGAALHRWWCGRSRCSAWFGLHRARTWG